MTTNRSCLREQVLTLLRESATSADVDLAARGGRLTNTIYSEGINRDISLQTPDSPNTCVGKIHAFIPGHFPVRSSTGDATFWCRADCGAASLMLHWLGGL
jgi:hypothetical protein